jgi:hypothetical protein
MHQREHGARHEAVIDEGVLLDAERGVAAFEIAGARIGSACTKPRRSIARFSVVGGNRLDATA